MLAMGAACAAATVALEFVARRWARTRGVNYRTPHRRLAVVALTAGVVGALLPASIAVPAAATVGGALVTAFVDATTGSIPDDIVLVMLVTALGTAVLTGRFSDGAVGGVLAGGALLFLHAITRGAGLGFGDVKLATALGWSLGWDHVATFLAVAFVVAALAGLALLARGRSARTRIPFAPFLATGAFVAAFVQG